MDRAQGCGPREQTACHPSLVDLSVLRPWTWGSPRLSSGFAIHNTGDTLHLTGSLPLDRDVGLCASWAAGLLRVAPPPAPAWRSRQPGGCIETCPWSGVERWLRKGPPDQRG